MDVCEGANLRSEVPPARTNSVTELHTFSCLRSSSVLYAGVAVPSQPSGIQMRTAWQELRPQICHQPHAVGKPP